MIIGEALDVVLERINSRGGEYARLPHRAAEGVLPAPRALDEVLAPGEHGADGAAEPFAQIDPDGVEALRVIARADAGRDRRVEQPRAVHVRLHAALVRDFTHLAQLLQRPDRAGAEVMRLLDAQHAR